MYIDMTLILIDINLIDIIIDLLYFYSIKCISIE